jgi:hypothetical protein
VLLAGDAVHAHTTAGGQGLNTGVQDGYDVGWKLATVVRGGDPALLDSYEAERRPASVRAVANGDQQTRMWLLRRPAARLLRNTVMRVLSATGLLERKAIPLLAQLDLDHSGSPAVAASDAVTGVPRTLRPGRRSPDAALAPVRGTAATSLHDHLAAGRHTLLVYGAGPAGEAAVRAAETVRERGVGDTVQVLWIQPADTVATQVPYEGGELIVARDQGRTLGAAASPWVAYVRPDGVVAAGSAPAGLDALLARLPSREPLTASVPSLRP